MAIKDVLKVLVTGIALQCPFAPAENNAEYGSAGAQVSDGGEMPVYNRLVDKLKEPDVWRFYWSTQEDTETSIMPFEVRYKVSNALVNIAKENGSGEIPDYKNDTLGIREISRFRQYLDNAQAADSRNVNDTTCGAAVVFTFPALLGEFLGKTSPALVAKNPGSSDELNLVASSAHRNSLQDEKLLRTLCAGPKYESIVLAYFNFLDMLKSEDHRFVADAVKAHQASVYPYTALISCGMGGQNMNVLACFQKSDLKITTSNGGKLYKVYNLADAGTIDRKGLHINLPGHFEIAAQNSHSTLVLKLDIADRNGKIVYSDEQGAYGIARASN